MAEGIVYTDSDQKTIAAFFDFDETLLAIDSAGIGFKVLKEQGYLTRTFIIKMVSLMFLWKVGIIDEHRMAKTMLGFYRGWELQPFVEEANAFYSEYLQPNLAPAVVKRLRWHQKQDHQIVLVTGSIDYYLKPVVEDLEIDHLLCTHLEIDSKGFLTGRPAGPVCVSDTKVVLARQLAQKEKLDMSRSYAYGNSHLDIPLLKEVGHPIIVNPNTKLVKHARKHHWPTLKDEQQTREGE